MFKSKKSIVISELLVRLSNGVKITFFIITGIALIGLGALSFFLPITNSGMTILEVDELCHKNSGDFIQTEDKEACEAAKFFNLIYFLFAVGLVLIFWSGFMEKHYGRKKL